MKLSVIVPICNVEKYLRQCLLSLQNQTMKDEIEFICIDDGSTDNSLAILEEFGRADSRFIVISKPNEGYGKTMNLGLDLARGEYIGILESDDFANREMFEVLYKKAKETDTEIVKGNYSEYRNNETKDIDLYDNDLYERVIIPTEHHSMFVKGPAIWCGIYKKEFLNKYNIRFNETPGASYQDTAFYFMTWMYAKKVVLIRDYLMNYRLDNINSSVNNPKKIFCICEEYKYLEKRLIEEQADIRIWYLFQYMKFSKYLWNFRRLSSQYQYAFLEEMNRQFIEVNKNGLLCHEYWGKIEWDLLSSLLTDKEAFYKREGKKVIPDKIDSFEKTYLRFARDGIIDALKAQDNIYIYGAGAVGKTIYQELKKEKVINVKAFIVSEKKEVVWDMDDIPIYSIEDMLEQPKDIFILVAVSEKFQQAIKNILIDSGYTNCMVTDELFWRIWNNGNK